MTRSLHRSIPLTLFGVAVLTLLAGALLTRYRAEAGLMIAMRDGVRLRTAVYLPAKSGRTGTLLLRSPYNDAQVLPQGWQEFLDNGFAIVLQDVRGRGGSEGTFGDIRQEIFDGSDTLDWIARQPWSNGCVGMLGSSYRGIVQWQAALSGNRHLCAMAPALAGWDEYFDRFYSRGGGFKLGHRLLWFASNFGAAKRQPFARYVEHLPLGTADEEAAGRQLDLYRTVMEHPLYDDYWRSLSARVQIDKIRVPALIVAGWYDNYAQSDLEAFRALQERGVPARAITGPWTHDISDAGIVQAFSERSRAGIRAEQLAWMKRYLKMPQSGKPASGRLRYFLMGANEWQEAAQWPLPYRPQQWYLDSGGNANTASGDGVLRVDTPRREGFDSYLYDPLRPVPTRGGNVCCNGQTFPWGPLDQQDVEKRSDVLVYTSQPLTLPLDVVGNVRAKLWVSSSAKDTDVMAKLVAVKPGGRALIVCDGMLRLRYRDGLDRAVLLQPKQQVQVEIDLGVTATRFAAGDRLRLEVSSSNFPKYDRNMNTGRLQAEETRPVVALQKVWHGGAKASHLLLPTL